jgi:gas vesicle protein
MKNTFGVIAAFIGGAVVGAAIGMLYAPETGEETRKKIKDALEKRGIKLSKDDLNDLVDEIKSEVTNEEK